MSWGNEYVRNLAAEIADEFHHRQDTGESTQQLLSLVSQIVPYHMTHNAGAALAHHVQPHPAALALTWHSRSELSDIAVLSGIC